MNTARLVVVTVLGARLTVTVCAVFQLAGVKVIVLGEKVTKFAPPKVGAMGASVHY